MRKFVIPDIRGELNLFKDLLEKISPTEDDFLIFCGSYLGPGPDSKGVVEYILQLHKKLPNMSFLRGCYEFMFEVCIETNPARNNLNVWAAMGGAQVLKSYASEEKLIVLKAPDNSKNGKPTPMRVEIPLRIPNTHIEFFQGLAQWYEDDIFPYVVCHSGGHPLLHGGCLVDEKQTVFCEDGWWEVDDVRIPGKTVIFSHYPFQKPFNRAGKIGLDLGAGIGGKLCTFEMMSQQFTTVGK